MWTTPHGGPGSSVSEREVAVPWPDHLPSEWPSSDESTDGVPDDPPPVHSSRTYIPRSPRGTTASRSPLDLRFSQSKVRHTFWDGCLLADVAPLVRVIRCSEEEAVRLGAPWRLEAPFPMIEVMYWRCKLRDKRTGRPKTERRTGNPVFDPDMHWFTLDNRRLYCLQVAAVKVWPERCVVDVAEIGDDKPEFMREIRKFRTLDSGESIEIGSNADNVPFTRWSWKEEVGAERVGDVSNDDAVTTAVMQNAQEGSPTKVAVAGESLVSSESAMTYPTAGAWLLAHVQGKQVHSTPPAVDGEAKGAMLLGMLRGTSNSQAPEAEAKGVPRGTASGDSSWWQEDARWDGMWDGTSVWHKGDW